MADRATYRRFCGFTIGRRTRNAAPNSVSQWSHQINGEQKLVGTVWYGL
ncbi:hemolysin secretion domain protein [Vibrio parahaemolyticus VPTS-2010_2]|nr:hemolysin secretion domain protein [Vibrio parahaemolyticus VPTS-2010_2]